MSNASSFRRVASTLRAGPRRDIGGICLCFVRALPILEHAELSGRGGCLATRPSAELAEDRGDVVVDRPRARARGAPRRRRCACRRRRGGARPARAASARPGSRAWSRRGPRGAATPSAWRRALHGLAAGGAEAVELGQRLEQGRLVVRLCERARRLVRAAARAPCFGGGLRVALELQPVRLRDPVRSARRARPPSTASTRARPRTRDAASRARAGRRPGPRRATARRLRRATRPPRAPRARGRAAAGGRPAARARAPRRAPRRRRGLRAARGPGRARSRG